MMIYMLPWLLPCEDSAILFRVVADVHKWMYDAVHIDFLYTVLKHDHVVALNSSFLRQRFGIKQQQARCPPAALDNAFHDNQRVAAQHIA